MEWLSLLITYYLKPVKVHLYQLVFWYKDFSLKGENQGLKHNNNIKLFLKDGVHLTDEGYYKLAKYIKGLLKGLKDNIILWFKLRYVRIKRHGMVSSTCERLIFPFT